MSDKTTPQDSAAMTLAPAGYAVGWMLPELPKEALARDRSLARRYTRITKFVDGDLPDAYASWLTVGQRHFRVAVFETKEEAEWHCWTLTKALMAVINSALSGVPIDGPEAA